jgi:hypothetical protein
MLSLTTKFGGLLAAAALAIGLAGAASAATLTWSAQPAVVGPSPTATSSTGTVVENDASDIVKVRRNPWGPGSTNVYNSVSFGWSEYAFDTLKGALSFVWGSPDKFNSVQFFRNGDLIDTIAGFGNGSNLVNSHLMATDIGDGDGFDTVRFVSKHASFEHAFIRFIPLAPVPVPAAGLLLLTAVGAVSLLRRRKTA